MHRFSLLYIPRGCPSLDETEQYVPAEKESQNAEVRNYSVLSPLVSLSDLTSHPALDESAQ